MDSRRRKSMNTRPNGPSGGPDCWKCKWAERLDLQTIACRHPLITDLGIEEARKALEIRGAEMGVRRGWFVWPSAFDPKWLERCQGFREK